MHLPASAYDMLREELRQLRRAPLPLLTATVLPLLAWLAIAATMQQPIVRDIPVTVVDEDATPMSRSLTRALDATQALRIIETCSDPARGEDLVRNGEAVLLFHIERGMAGAIRSGGSARCGVLADGAQLLYAKVGYRAAATTLQTFSAGVQLRRLIAAGLPPEAAHARAVPVRTEIHTVENSWFDYAYYLVPGMMMAILQMSASFSALWFFREHRDRNARLRLPRPGRTAAFYFAHGVPLLLANIAAVVLLFLLVFPLSGIPFSESTPALFARALLLMIVGMGMGALLSALFGNLVTAAQVGLLVNAPAFVFSGYTFPRWAMPDGIRVIAECIPLTHLLDGFFPLLIFGEARTDGLWQLLLFGLLFWGGTVLLVSRSGRRLHARIHIALRRIVQMRHPRPAQTKETLP